MHMSDMIYMFHQMRDVAISMWETSPAMIIGIGVALAGATYFVFKR